MAVGRAIWRGQRYGRSALVDALRRCGRKPMTLEADESGKGWFEDIGFRTVGRRSAAGGGSATGWAGTRPVFLEKPGTERISREVEGS